MQLHNILIKINESVVRTETESDLLNDLCHIMVECELISMAWIGIHDPVAQIIFPRFMFGSNLCYLDEMLTQSSKNKINTPNLTTDAQGRHIPIIINDIANDDTNQPAWCNQMISCGWKSCAYFPIFRNNVIYATLALHCENINTFSEDLTRVIASITQNISFKLDTITNKNTLAKSREHNQLWAENTTNVICMFDLENKQFSYISPSAEELCGYSIEELTSLNVRHLFTRQSFTSIAKSLSHRLASLKNGDDCSKTQSHLAVLKSKDGNHLTIEIETTLVTDEVGNLLKIKCLVCERNKCELKTLQLAADHCDTSIVITNSNAEIVYVNQQYIEMTGYTRDELLGKNPNINSAQHYDKNIFKEMWTALRKGKMWEGVFNNQTKKGREYATSLRIVPVKQLDGSVSHYVGSQKNITKTILENAELIAHRHNIEELVRIRGIDLHHARQAAESANRSKTTFLANMSHEIRTPLNAIIGMTYLLKEKLTSPEHVNKLNKINNAAEHLLTIINDILDLSKIEAGKLTISNTNFQLQDVLDKVNDLVFDKAREKGLLVTINVFENVPQHLNGDPLRLGQILINYASNAYKYTKEGAISLTIKVLDETDDDLILQFSLIDTGIGLSIEQQTALFQPFHQAESGTSRKYGGTGLGLAITKQLAELMGGHIGLESQLGKGSTFWFTARFKRVTSLQPHHHDLESSKLTIKPNTHILLVEDDPIDHDITIEVLRTFGMKVDMASNGKEALTKINDCAYDLILMDTHMLTMDDIESTRLIREVDKKSIPIIGMSTDAFVDDLHFFENTGMNAHLIKPITPDKLYSTLAHWLPDTDAKTPNLVSINSLINASSTDITHHINFEIGLHHFDERLSSHLDSLSKFSMAHRDDAGKLRLALNNQDSVLARRITHTLKGISSAMGMQRINHLTYEIENKIFNGTIIDAELDKFILELEESLNSICLEIPSITHEDSKNLSNQLDSNHIKILLDNLLDQLSNDDIGATDTWDALSSILPVVIGDDKFRRLNQQIQSFDFDIAYNTLRQSIINEQVPIFRD
jgi:PAS domain S-box-containing protein